jgi:hypothetical protein
MNNRPDRPKYGYRFVTYERPADIPETALYWDVPRAEWRVANAFSADQRWGMIAGGATFCEPIPAPIGYELRPQSELPRKDDLCVGLIGGPVCVPRNLGVDDLEDPYANCTFFNPVANTETPPPPQINEPNNSTDLQTKRIKALEWIRDAGKELFCADVNSRYADFVNGISCLADIEIQIAEEKQC